MNNKLFYYVACVFLFIKGCGAFLDVVQIKSNGIINDASESLPYKIGLVTGMILQVVIYFGLTKFIFQKFIMTKSLKELNSIEKI
ncbi:MULTISPECIES: hypothetical protein [Kaistella]|uniref:hypothetical protein n=1 Tax=Kaistella TaxID=2782231 RepID=UPI002734B648|nr:MULTISPECIES: hypothetical protein [Kaistella]MDP2454395.1 hypothetical protein [Kaistella sp. SH11-4b]MDP2457882.1 hypothetical protein [Kaistella sp. SH40-3]MDP2460788.1 hypothetical protein [Kaistella sp. SH19-2b]